MKITTDSDKIVLETGEKDVSILSGKKNVADVSGTATKQITKSGEKDILQLSVLKNLLDLDGEKYQDDLDGEKHIPIIYGSTDKDPILLGEAFEGYWHIRVDTTYYFADDTLTTADRD